MLFMSLIPRKKGEKLYDYIAEIVITEEEIMCM